MSVYKSYNPNRTPQTKKAHPAQVRNNAGGYSFQIDAWGLLRRFLILGSEGTYYVSGPELTRRNAENVVNLIRSRGRDVVDEIVAVSVSGRAPKNSPALFALALAASVGDDATRRAAFDALPRVARTASHLFEFLAYARNMRGTGRGLRRAVAAWYNRLDPDALALQAVKYRRRSGWTHRDALRIAHPRPADEAHDAIYRWLTSGQQPDEPPRILDGFIQAQAADNPKDWTRLARDYRLTWEMLPTAALKHRAVWEALLPNMPVTALMRNLGRLTAVGLIGPGSEATRLATARLTDTKRLQGGRVHPLAVLVAARTYASGRGVRGSLVWHPVPAIIDALDEAFYKTFANVRPIGRPVLLAVDVSGSMSARIAGMPISAREAAFALALVTARVEPDAVIIGYDDDAYPLSISPRQRLDDVMRAAPYTYRGTDCAQPFIWAKRYFRRVEAVIQITDNQTWFGKMHPFQALGELRHSTGLPVRSVYVAATAEKASNVAPGDPLSLDVVGFDTATPNLMAAFARGEF